MNSIENANIPTPCTTSKVQERGMCVPFIHHDQTSEVQPRLWLGKGVGEGGGNPWLSTTVLSQGHLTLSSNTQH